jgi:hypothetical protein
MATKPKLVFGFDLDTPHPARKVRNFALKLGVALVTIGGAIMALPSAGIAVPAVLLTYAGHAVAYGGAISTVTAAISQAFGVKPDDADPAK